MNNVFKITKLSILLSLTQNVLGSEAPSLTREQLETHISAWQDSKEGARETAIDYIKNTASPFNKEIIDDAILYGLEYKIDLKNLGDMNRYITMLLELESDIPIIEKFNKALAEKNIDMGKRWKLDPYGYMFPHRFLDLSGLDLRSIPDEIGILSQLKISVIHISCKNNPQLTYLSPHIADLKDLVELDLRNTSITIPLPPYYVWTNYYVRLYNDTGFGHSIVSCTRQPEPSLELGPKYFISSERKSLSTNNVPNTAEDMWFIKSYGIEARKKK